MDLSGQIVDLWANNPLVPAHTGVSWGSPGSGQASQWQRIPPSKNPLRLPYRGGQVVCCFESQMVQRLIVQGPIGGAWKTISTPAHGWNALTCVEWMRHDPALHCQGEWMAPSSSPPNIFITTYVPAPFPFRLHAQNSSILHDLPPTSHSLQSYCFLNI